MIKQPLTLMIRIDSGVHTGIEDTHCAIAKRIRLPIPPPTATKKYLLIKSIWSTGYHVSTVASRNDFSSLLPIKVGSCRCRQIQGQHQGDDQGKKAVTGIVVDATVMHPGQMPRDIRRSISQWCCDITLNDVHFLASSPNRQLDRSAKIDGLAHISNQLVKVIKELCEVAPQEMLTRLHQIVPKLSSQQPQEEILKAQLVSLYETLGQIDEIALAIVPDLYRALMDFSSVKVRGTAIGAVANILRWNSQIIQENMRDMLILYLNDPACRCMSRVWNL